MPTSDFSTVPIIAQLIRSQEPKSILDVGIGFGKWGFMARELQDIAYERVKKEDWQIKIVGVEAFEPYRNPIWEYIYDEIIIDDIKKRKKLLTNFDLVLFLDVLEHMERDEGIELLDIVTRAGKKYIVSMPMYNSPQGAFAGNQYEIHKSAGDWTPKDFKQYTLIANKVVGWN